MFTRREILTAFLGAPFAAAACKKKAIAVPEGMIVGAGVERGHRIREPQALAVPKSRYKKRKIVIVGGGVAGLAAGRTLLKAGERDFEICELEDVTGGTAQPGETASIPHPWGAHYINAPMPDQHEMIALLSEMGVMESATEVGEQFRCREPEERVFFRGRWYEGLYLRAGASAEDLALLHAFEEVIAGFVARRDAEGRRAFAIPMATSAENQALDAISMHAWMEAHGFNRSARLRWLVDYACRDDYGARPHDTSAWAGLFYFAARKQTPKSESQPVVTWPEGNGRLVKHLSQKTQDFIATGATVSALQPHESGVDVQGIGSDGQSFGIHAQKVIFAAPQLLVPHLLKDSDRRAHEAFHYSVWMVSNLLISERPNSPLRDFPMAWDNVFYDSPSVGYVLATHQRGREHGPTVLTHYLPLVDGSPSEERKRLFALNHAEAADLVLSDIGRAHPDIRSLCTRIDIMRYGHAMVRPRPGFIFGAERKAAAAPYRGIHFAHSDLSGIPLFEEAFCRGNAAARAVLA